MTREDAIDQLVKLMTYNDGMTGEEPDYGTVWTRIQDLTDFIWYHQPDPGEWEPSEGYKAFLKRIES